MATSPKPPIVKDPYPHKTMGFFGEFGTGGGTRICYLQTGLRPQELQRLTLVSEIPGSEQWSVRNLFQREVDYKRVDRSILPYLLDKDRVKFFNPLTLTLLPVDPASNEVSSTVPNIIEKNEIIESAEWHCLEAEGLYRFRHLKDSAAWALLEWNDAAVKVCAIDGQHRLCALQQLLRDPNHGQEVEFEKWTIPAVIAGIRDVGGTSKTILDVIRSVFIYINTEARSPNEARQILLSDESITKICAQELLDYAHKNDIQPVRNRDRHRVPLLFFDWRGEEELGVRRVSPAALQKIEEVHAWLEEYLLGEDFSTTQEVALGVQPVDTLKKVYKQRAVDSAAARQVREHFKKRVLPGLAFFLENFAPYRSYIARLRDLEDKYMKESSHSRHAFHQLRFGTHQAGLDPRLRKHIEGFYDNIIEDIQDLKADHKVMPHLLQLDLGIRGLVSAFGALRLHYGQSVSKSADWLEYAEWFTDGANKVHADGWFGMTDQKKRALLLHLTHDHNEQVPAQLYKLDRVKSAFGNVCALLVASYGAASKGIPTAAIRKGLWEVASEELDRILQAGYRKEVAAVLRDKFPNGGKRFKDAVNDEAGKRAGKHIERLRQALKRIHPL